VLGGHADDVVKALAESDAERVRNGGDRVSEVERQTTGMELAKEATRRFG
jgi:hypothetical protein